MYTVVYFYCVSPPNQMLNLCNLLLYVNKIRFDIKVWCSSISVCKTLFRSGAQLPGKRWTTTSWLWHIWWTTPTVTTWRRACRWWRCVVVMASAPPRVTRRRKHLLLWPTLYQALMATSLLPSTINWAIRYSGSLETDRQDMNKWFVYHY